MEHNLSIAARTALTSGVVTLAMAGATVAVHRAMRGHAARLEGRIQELARDMALCFTGGVTAEQLRARSEAAHGEAFWGAIQRFTDNISGEEWRRLSQRLQGVRHLEDERRRLARGGSWRMALAARRLGMIDDPESREALRGTLVRGRPGVRLPALLSLARLQDANGLRWLFANPRSAEDVSPSILLAILKRFGRGFAPEVLAVIEGATPRGPVAVAAIEALGSWRATGARAPLERILRSGGLEERVAAARALGHLREPESAAALVAALEDPDWQVRAQAARSLGRIGDLAALPRLEAGVTDEGWWVRRNAGYALADLGPAGIAVLRRIATRSGDRYARDMAAEALQAWEWEQQSPGGIGRVG